MMPDPKTREIIDWCLVLLAIAIFAFICQFS